MPIQAFIDDTWGDEAFVLAGLLGPAEDWLVFTDEWQAVLNKPPKRPGFKWRYAMQQYKLRPDAVQDRMRELVATINRYPFTILSCSVDLAGFNQTMADAMALTPFKDAYFIPFQSVIYQICHELFLLGNDERFEIIFDEQMVFGPRAKKWYPLARRLMPTELQQIAPIEPFFRPDDEVVPLQAADLIVGFLRNELEGADHPFKWIRGAIGEDKWSPHSQKFTAERFQALIMSSLKLVAKTWIQRVQASPPLDVPS